MNDTMTRSIETRMDDVFINRIRFVLIISENKNKKSPVKKLADKTTTYIACSYIKRSESANKTIPRFIENNE